MAVISEKLFDFSEGLWGTVGFGNIKAFLAFCGAALISLLFVAGIYLPALAAAINWIVGGSIGLGTFIGVTVLLAEAGEGAVVCGAIMGIAAGALAVSFYTVAAYAAPVVGAALLLPNVICAVAYTLGCMASAIETCCSCLYACLCCCCIPRATVDHNNRYDDPNSPGSGQNNTHVRAGSSTKSGGYDYGTSSSAYAYQHVGAAGSAPSAPLAAASSSTSGGYGSMSVDDYLAFIGEGYSRSTGSSSSSSFYPPYNPQAATSANRSGGAQPQKPAVKR